MRICKKNWFSFILGIGIVLPTVASSFMTTPESSRYLDIELPFRCSADQPSEGEKVASSIALSERDFSVRLPNQSDELPRYHVNGFSFKNKTADVAVAELLEEAGIKVVAEKGTYPTLSAENLRGEFKAVLEELMKLGNCFYTYHADEKTLYLSRKAKAVVQVPHNEMVMMAVLDALNGGRFNPIEADWEKYQIDLRLSRSELERVQLLLADLVKGKYILATQIQLYSLDSDVSDVHWQSVVDALGKRDISSIQNALVGQAIYLRSDVSEQRFLNAAKKYFTPVALASGKAVVPNGWKTRFNFHQCVQSPIPSNDLSVFLRTSMKKKGMAQTVLTLDSSKGEVASFDLDNNLNQKIVIVGIPVPKGSNPYLKQELMLTLQFHFIQLIKKGEQNG